MLAVLDGDAGRARCAPRRCRASGGSRCLRFGRKVFELADLVAAHPAGVGVERLRVGVGAGLGVGAQQPVEVELDVGAAGAEVGVVADRALDPDDPRPQRVGDERAVLLARRSRRSGCRRSARRSPTPARGRSGRPRGRTARAAAGTGVVGAERDRRELHVAGDDGDLVLVLDAAVPRVPRRRRSARAPRRCRSATVRTPDGREPCSVKVFARCCRLEDEAERDPALRDRRQAAEPVERSCP